MTKKAKLNILKNCQKTALNSDAADKVRYS